MQHGSDPDAPLVAYRLTICGLDELSDHAGSGVSHAISILDPGMPVPAVLSSYDGLREHWVLHFNDVTRALGDARMPERADIEELLSFGAELAAADAGAHVLVHCHAGISRSTAAAAILLAQHRPGREREALRDVVRLRPQAWPNMRMLQLADAVLGREGALVAAVEGLRDERLGGRRDAAWFDALFDTRRR